MPRGPSIWVRASSPSVAAVARGAVGGGGDVPGLRHGRRRRGRRAAGGVPVVRRARAGVLHDRARLHHGRHGPHPPARRLRRSPPRQAPRHIIWVCDAVHRDACSWSDRLPRARAPSVPVSWLDSAWMLPWGNRIQCVIQVTLVAKGDVPLSVMMTICSTLSAVFLTPLLTKVLAGAYIPVDAAKLSLSTLQVVVAPIILGSSIQSAFPSVVEFVTPFAPLLAVLASSLLACSVFSENFVRFRSTIADASGNGKFFSGDIGVIMLSVFLLHFAGFFVGYAAAAIVGLKERQRRAISIEVGMQNSSLAVVLATAHFSSPLVALPPALSAVIMNIMGSTMGLVWQCIIPSVSEDDTNMPADA